MKTQALLIKTAHSRIVDINEKLEIQFSLHKKERNEKMLALLDIQIDALKNERDFWEEQLDRMLNEL